MMNTEIVIYVGSEQYKLDLIDDVVIPLNFSLDDIFKLESRKTNFSKTIDIPGTKNNNLAFNHAYKINSRGSFDTRVKHRCVIKCNGLIVFDGVMMITGVKERLQYGVTDVVYQIVVLGEIFNFFDLFSNY